MGNKAYCRMKNTHNDLDDVAEHINDNDLSESETKHRYLIIKLCEEILENTGRLDEIIEDNSD